MHGFMIDAVMGDTMGKTSIPALGCLCFSVHCCKSRWIFVGLVANKCSRAMTCKVGNGNVDNSNGSRQGNKMMLWLGSPEWLL